MIREVKEKDLDRCFEIEADSYAGDEAASKAKILKRIQQYPQGFIVFEVDGKIAGFINSGATDTVELSNEAFKELVGHDPDGQHIVIMSVVVHPDYQGKGIAGKLLKRFMINMRELGKSSVYLICQTELIDLYAKYGFDYIGESESDHGGMRWHEMVLVLKERE